VLSRGILGGDGDKPELGAAHKIETDGILRRHWLQPKTLQQMLMTPATER